MWWLLAPVMTTGVGAMVLQLRERRLHRHHRRDPMAEHQALLTALAKLESARTTAIGSPISDR
jgi:cytochrome c-type biogenesis protein CcmH/NrfF